MHATSSADTIFVSIASYRDPDCQNTIRNLFEQATYPERVFIGVCLQVAPEDADSYSIEPPRPSQIRVDPVDAADSKGACWARSRVQKLWRGEDYFFQVDSHMRFVPGWDEKCITMLAQCEGSNPVLSTYPLIFTPPDQYAEPALATMHVAGFDDTGIICNGSSLSPIEQAPPTPQPSAFIAAGLLFASARIINEVPYDPHLYFWGEEISLAVRLFTHGWNIHQPNQVLAFHDYTIRPARPRHWENRTDWSSLNERSRRRVAHLLNITATNNADDLIDFDRFGLGDVRTVADYERFADVDFKLRLYRGKPLPEKRFAADEPAQIAARTAVFAQIWRDNVWGCTETCSGQGSALTCTAALRTGLRSICAELDIRILADAGCGDLNWIAELLPMLRLYFGYDIVPDLVTDLRQRFGDSANCFFKQADIVMDSLSAADAILCRDCLTHLPLDAAMMVLRRFKQTGAKYLLATTHATARNVWIASGGWYAIDLTAAPFNFPPPDVLLIDDETGTKRLGVWPLQQLTL